MSSQARSFLQRLLKQSPRVQFAVLVGGVAILSLAVTGCSGGDDDDADATQAGAVVTATRAATVTATSAPALPRGTLVPLDTSTPAPTSPPPPGATPSPTPEPAAMIDMVPCLDQTYFDTQKLDNGAIALTYKDVPAGTPILFPFQQGRLRRADSREGGMVLAYDVPGVGVITIEAAGADSLDREARYVSQGDVIGHFGGTFEATNADAFPGYQMFALVSSQDIVQVGDKTYLGEPIIPDVTDCLVLP